MERNLHWVWPIMKLRNLSQNCDSLTCKPPGPLAINKTNPPMCQCKVKWAHLIRFLLLLIPHSKIDLVFKMLCKVTRQWTVRKSQINHTHVICPHLFKVNYLCQSLVMHWMWQPRRGSVLLHQPQTRSLALWSGVLSCVSRHRTTSDSTLMGQWTKKEQVPVSQQPATAILYTRPQTTALGLILCSQPVEVNYVIFWTVTVAPDWTSMCSSYTEVPMKCPFFMQGVYVCCIVFYAVFCKK